MSKLNVDFKKIMASLFELVSTELYSECGLFERLTKIEAEFPGANVILHKTGKLPPVRFIKINLSFSLLFSF